MSIVIDYVKNLVPVNWNTNPTGWTSGNCPMCVTNGQPRPDTKGRGGFYFDEEKFQYHCFNCQYSTGWSPGHRINDRLKRLLQKFGAEERDVQRLQLELLKEQDVAELLLQRERREKLVINWPEMELPDNTVAFMDYPEPDNDWITAATYLTERGFDIEDERFMYSPARLPARMNKRFVIPFTYKGKTVGYTARWSGTPPEGIPKYYNKQPSNYVYGLDQQTADKQVVILTEGPLDAIVVDGISAGTNTISEGQADVIISLNKPIIVLPDRDRAGNEMVKAALRYGWSVSFPEWDDCKDAGDAQLKYGRLYTVRSILDSAVNNPIKIQVLAKSYCQ
jgi:DNA primase